MSRGVVLRVPRVPHFRLHPTVTATATATARLRDSRPTDNLPSTSHVAFDGAASLFANSSVVEEGSLRFLRQNIPFVEDTRFEPDDTVNKEGLPGHS